MLKLHGLRVKHGQGEAYPGGVAGDPDSLRSAAEDSRTVGRSDCETGDPDSLRSSEDGGRKT